MYPVEKEQRREDKEGSHQKSVFYPKLPQIKKKKFTLYPVLLEAGPVDSNS